MTTPPRVRLPWRFLLPALLLLPAPPALPDTPKPLRVLLLSGQNNHDWKTTTPALHAILTQSGRFAVEVTEHPEHITATALAPYHVIVGNWNAWGDAPVKQWPPAARDAFLDFLRQGRGYVSIHAGSSSFYDWPDYQQIGGMFWNLDVTSHGPPHEFTVTFPHDHPVTRGLDPFRTRDELWLRPGVHPAAQVIALADDQPLAATTALGQGRGFALLLGHSAEFMQNPGFQTLLLRGAEWAATGQVSAPSTLDPSLNADAILQAVATYRFGQDRQPILNLERWTHTVSAHPPSKSKAAAAVAAALHGNATPDAKRCLLEALSLLGSAPEIPALARALTQPDLFDHARQALERIPDEAAGDALQAALTTAKGPSRAALIQSLAHRPSPKALPQIAKYLADPDPTTVRAALDALGRLGGPQAAAALQAAEPTLPPSLRSAWGIALLRTAHSLQTMGPASEAAALFARLAQPDLPNPVRRAAFPAHVIALGESGAAALLAALTSTDHTLQSAALQTLGATRSPALLRAAADHLDQLPIGWPEAILTLCGDCADPSLLPAVTQTLAHPRPEVRQAAIAALATLGNATSVEPLARLSDTGTDEDRKAILETLTRLREPAVNQALLDALRDTPPTRPPTVIRALAARRASSALPTLLSCASHPNPNLRLEAIRALGLLADTPTARSLVPLLDRADDRTRDALEAALIEICERNPAAVTPLAHALPKAPSASQIVLLSVLGSTSTPEACAAIRTCLPSANPEVHLAAVRALASWPTSAPLEDLAKVVETSQDPKARALAARGVSRMAAHSPPLATRAAQALAAALAAASDPAAQRNYLESLAALPSLPSLQAAQNQLANPTLSQDAQTAVLTIAHAIYPWHRAEVKTALDALKTSAPSPELLRQTDALLQRIEQPANLARGGVASSPDGLEKDGHAGGDQAAIDGNPETYWDEVDGQKSYRLRIQLRQRSTLGFLRLLAFAHHDYAPRDFQILCDDRLVHTVTNAQYQNARLTVPFPPVTCDTVELHITGVYGLSPAIRELELYDMAPPPPDP